MPEYPPHTEPDPDVAGYLLGTLTDEEAAAFAAHLEGCPVCRAEVDDLSGLPGLLDGLPPAEDLPAGLEEATFAAIERAATPGGEDGVVVPLSRPGSGAGSNSRSITGGRRRPRTSWLLAAAAVLVIAAVVSVAALTRRSGPAPTAAPLGVVHLVAPNGGPAHGTATIDGSANGLSIKLVVADLPPSPAGTFYTCWLVGAGDTLAHQNRVSVGSFTVGSSGSASVQWTTGASLQQFPALGITLEPANGNPLHQGQKVLQAV
jgi:hypothetical protein